MWIDGNTDGIVLVYFEVNYKVNVERWTDGQISGHISKQADMLFVGQAGRQFDRQADSLADRRKEVNMNQ